LLSSLSLHDALPIFAGLAAFPEESGVVTDARQWSLVPGWLGLLLCRLGGFRALRRLELEYPEHLPADLLIRTTVLSLGEVTHHHGNEEAGAQRSGLFLTHRVQFRGEVQALAGHDRAIEVQVRVHRYHRRVSVGLDHLQHFKVVFGAGALRK